MLFFTTTLVVLYHSNAQEFDNKILDSIPHPLNLNVQSTLDLTDLDLTDFGFNGLQTNADPCCSHSPITPEDDVQDANRAELMIISVSD